MTVALILLSLTLPLAFGLAWVLTAVRRRVAAGALAAGLAFAAAGSVSGGVPRPVPDLMLTVAAPGGGVALGRVLPLKPPVVAVFPALASIADITQNALFGGTGRGSPSGPTTAAPSWQAYTVLWIPRLTRRQPSTSVLPVTMSPVGGRCGALPFCVPGWDQPPGLAERRGSSAVLPAPPGTKVLRGRDLSPWHVLG